MDDGDSTNSKGGKEMTLQEAIESVKELRGSLIENDEEFDGAALATLISHAERTLKSQRKQQERTRMLIKLGRESEKSGS